MPISDKHKLVFIHIPKNAGTSIEKSFHMRATGHKTWDTYQKQYLEEWSRYTSFCVVRNPFDRLVSNYEYARREESYWHSTTNPEQATYGKHPDYEFLKDRSFSECVSALPHLIRNGHPGWKPQHIWVCDGDHVHVNEVLQFESLSEDITRFCHHHDVSPIALQHLNATGNQVAYQEYYNEDLIEVVSSIYRMDLDLFGYEFDNSMHAGDITTPEPDTPSALRAAGEHLVHGRYSDALTAYEEILHHTPYDSDALNDAAVASAFTGQRDRALVYLRRALHTAPQHVKAQKNIHALTGIVGNGRNGDNAILDLPRSNKDISTSPTADEPTTQSRTYLQMVQKTDGWLSLNEATLLHDVALQIKSGCIVEVGSYRGRSTIALGTAVMDEPDVFVYTLDPHMDFVGECGGRFGPKDRAAFYRTMLNSGCYNTVGLINLSSEVVTPGWSETVSFLWIDGDHSYEGTKRDIDCWLPHLAEDAHIAFHDTIDPDLGPHKVINELLDSGTFEKIKEVDSIKVLQRSSR